MNGQHRQKVPPYYYSVALNAQTTYIDDTIQNRKPNSTILCQYKCIQKCRAKWDMNHMMISTKINRAELRTRGQKDINENNLNQPTTYK